jgi:hypothetical protein
LVIELVAKILQKSVVCPHKRPPHHRQTKAVLGTVRIIR